MIGKKLPTSLRVRFVFVVLLIDRNQINRKKLSFIRMKAIHLRISNILHVPWIPLQTTLILNPNLLPKQKITIGIHLVHQVDYP
jgi:hypothetical protein